MWYFHFSKSLLYKCVTFWCIRIACSHWIVYLHQKLFLLRIYCVTYIHQLCETKFKVFRMFFWAPGYVTWKMSTKSTATTQEAQQQHSPTLSKLRWGECCCGKSLGTRSHWRLLNGPQSMRRVSNDRDIRHASLHWHAKTPVFWRSRPVPASASFRAYLDKMNCTKLLHDLGVALKASVLNFYHLTCKISTSHIVNMSSFCCNTASASRESKATKS